jgi:hypothetical protein
MMDDLISRQAAIDEANAWLLDCFKVQKQNRSCGLIRRLEDLPSAEPESAQWVQMLINPRLYKCSNCQIAWNKRLVFENEGYSNNILMRYCPRCGRKMKTEVDYE